MAAAAVDAVALFVSLAAAIVANAASNPNCCSSSDNNTRNFQRATTDNYSPQLTVARLCP